MIIRKILFSVVLMASVSGCVSPNYNYRPNTVEISKPELGTINVAYVGDHLLRQGLITNHDAIFLKYDVSVGMVGGYSFSSGYYIKTGDNEDKSGFYMPSPYGNGGSVNKTLLADPFKIMQVYYNKKKVCGVSVFNGKACSNNVDYEITTQQASSEGDFQQTLIYSGRIGNKINIGYREFSGNIARPAFNNDVEYDLSESNVIGYKGAKLEIIESTNEYIKYKVISNFNQN